jgi:hypothetical protein
MKLLALGLAVLLAAIAGSAAAKPAPPPKTKTRTAPSRIESLAMDGSRVAYDVAGSYGSKTRCNQVYVWNVRRNVAARVSGRATCLADNSSTGAGVRELALAGGRVAWIVNQGGNSESRNSLYVSSAARPREQLVASAFRTGDVSGNLTGNWLGGLVGSGSFLGLDHWATDSGGSVTSAKLQKIGARLGDLAEGNGTMLAKSTDGRAVAILREDSTIAVYSTRGALLRTIAPVHGPTEIAVRGDYLAALTTADTLEVYNVHSGRRLHIWRVAHGARSLDVSSGFAVYGAPFPSGGYTRVVHIRRLLGGRDRVLATTPPELTAVQLGPVGLAYAYSRIAANRPGAVVFVPISRVVRAAR